MDIDVTHLVLDLQERHRRNQQLQNSNLRINRIFETFEESDDEYNFNFRLPRTFPIAPVYDHMSFEQLASQNRVSLGDELGPIFFVPEPVAPVETIEMYHYPANDPYRKLHLYNHIPEIWFRKFKEMELHQQQPMETIPIWRLRQHIARANRPINYAKLYRGAIYGMDYNGPPFCHTPRIMPDNYFYYSSCHYNHRRKRWTVKTKRTRVRYPRPNLPPRYQRARSTENRQNAPVQHTRRCRPNSNHGNRGPDEPKHCNRPAHRNRKRAQEQRNQGSRPQSAALRNEPHGSINPGSGHHNRGPRQDDQQRSHGLERRSTFGIFSQSGRPSVFNPVSRNEVSGHQNRRSEQEPPRPPFSFFSQNVRDLQQMDERLRPFRSGLAAFFANNRAEERNREGTNQVLPNLQNENRRRVVWFNSISEHEPVRDNPGSARNQGSRPAENSFTFNNRSEESTHRQDSVFVSRNQRPQAFATHSSVPSFNQNAQHPFFNEPVHGTRAGVPPFERRPQFSSSEPRNQGPNPFASNAYFQLFLHNGGMPYFFIRRNENQNQTPRPYEQSSGLPTGQNTPNPFYTFINQNEQQRNQFSCLLSSYSCFPPLQHQENQESRPGAASSIFPPLYHGPSNVPIRYAPCPYGLCYPFCYHQPNLGRYVDRIIYDFNHMSLEELSLYTTPARPSYADIVRGQPDGQR